MKISVYVMVVLCIGTILLSPTNTLVHEISARKDIGKTDTWVRVLGGKHNEDSRCIVRSEDGGCVVAGGDRLIWKRL